MNIDKPFKQMMWKSFKEEFKKGWHILLPLIAIPIAFYMDGTVAIIITALYLLLFMVVIFNFLLLTVSNAKEKLLNDTEELLKRALDE